MRFSLTIGKIFGIPILVHINWILIAVLLTWSLAGGYFPQKFPGLHAGNYWFFGAITALLFFISILFHELGHALVAVDEDVPVNSITLFILGGVAHIAHEPETAMAEFRIVIAGPFVSIMLSALFYLAGVVTFPNVAISSACFYLCEINFILAIFNLLPGFPLDGGRMLRATFWMLKDNFDLATRWATYAGLGIAGLFVAGGLGLVFMNNIINGIWLALVGWYLGRAAVINYQQSIEEEIPLGHSLRQKLFQFRSRIFPRTGIPPYSLGTAMVLSNSRKKPADMPFNESEVPHPEK